MSYPSPGYGPSPYPAPPSNTLAIVALVLGILGLLGACLYGLGTPLGIAAVVVAIIAMRKAARGQAGGRGMAIGGLVTGIIAILIGIVWAVLLISVGNLVQECLSLSDPVAQQACIEEKLNEALGG